MKECPERRDGVKKRMGKNGRYELRDGKEFREGGAMGKSEVKVVGG